MEPEAAWRPLLRAALPASAAVVRCADGVLLGTSPRLHDAIAALVPSAPFELAWPALAYVVAPALAQLDRGTARAEVVLDLDGAPCTITCQRLPLTAQPATALVTIDAGARAAPIDAPGAPPLALPAVRAAVSAGVLVEDRDGNLALANPAARRLLGPFLPGWREAPAGWSLSDAEDLAVAPDAFAPARARAARASVRGQVAVVRTPTGDETWLAIDAEPIVDADGLLQSLVVTVTDRTEVMRMVRDLTESRRLLAEVMDASHDGFFARDFVTGRTVHSARMNALVGLPAVDTEAGADDWRRRIHPEDRERLERAYAAVFAGELARFDLTYRVRCEDGGWRWVRSRGKLVLRTSDGAPHRLIGTVSDMQEIKQLEAALAVSERRLREASIAGEVGLWELDLTTLVAWRTARHTAIFGDDGGPWGIDQFLAAVVPEDREIAARAIEVGRRAGEMHLEVRIRRGDGLLRWIEAAARLSDDTAGGPRLCGSVRDITARKWVELDLERSMRSSQARLTELEQRLRSASHLDGLLTACMHCQSVRNDDGTWQRLDAYVTAHTGTRFSHGICPTCVKIHFPED